MGAIAVRDDAHWRTLRASHVGSSDIAALFNMHAYGLTRWQLWHVKRGTLPDAFETDVMTQGKHFEPAIASYAQEKFKIQLRKVRRYLEADDCPALGASVDYEEYGGGTLIPTELKWSLWGKEWEYDGDDLTAIPDSYLLQVQHQLAAMPTAPHAQLIAFTGGDLRRMIIPRSEHIISAIKTQVTAFMKSVTDGIEPPVDFLADAEAVNTMAALRKLTTVEFPPEMESVFEEFMAAKAAEDEACAAKDAAKAKLLKHIIDNSGEIESKCVSTCGGYKITVSKIAESLGKLVTPDLVGQYLGGKKAHIRTSITEVKE